MTPSRCANYCSGLSYRYAGVEFGRECYCGDSLTNGASLDKTSTTCNMACSGNPSINCGGSNGLQLYENPSVYNAKTQSIAASSSSVYAAGAAATAAVMSKLPNGWGPAKVGCIQEVSGRALTGASAFDSLLTIEKCVSFCSNKGFSIAGLEYASECYCGNELSNGASYDSVSSTCNMPCGGDSTVTCGGPNGLQLYTGTPVKQVAPSSTSSAAATPTGPVLATDLPSGWSAASTNCIQEVSGRALTGATTASDDMTISKCIGFCSGKGFKLAAVEYGAECYCGNELVNGASLDLASGQCNMGCAGNTKVLCGGPNALQLYSNPNVVAPSSAVASPSSSPSPTAPSAPKPTYATNLPQGWKLADTPCIQEVTHRALEGYSVSTNDMTIPKCLAICDTKGFQYGAVEYGSECFCGNALANGASLSVPSGQCNMGCSGDPTTLCGGPDALQFYVRPDLTTWTNGFASKGCIQEVVGRALNATSLYAGDMSIEKCTQFCGDGGYSMAGLEYGEECFCGNSLVGGARVDLLSYECKMPCAGNDKQKCGGPDAINLFVKA